MMNINAPTPGLGEGIWTGTEMLVWGGFYFDGVDRFMNIGARYRPPASMPTCYTLTLTIVAPVVTRLLHCLILMAVLMDHISLRSSWIDSNNAGELHAWALIPFPGIHYLQAWAVDNASNVSAQAASKRSTSFSSAAISRNQVQCRWVLFG